MSIGIETIKKANTTMYFKVLIMFILTFGIGFIPTFGLITPVGMKVLGVFIGVLWGWVMIDILWTSIFAMVALGLTGLTGVTAVFQAGLSHPVVLMALTTSLFAAAMNACKITDLLCGYFLTRNIVKDRPWMLVTMMLIAGAMIGAFASSIAGVFLLWAITLKIADICGYQQGDKAIGYIIGLIVVVCCTASNCIPFQPGAIAFNGFLAQGIDGGTTPYAGFLIYNLIIQTILIGLLILCGKFILKLDLSKFNLPEEMINELKNQTITYEQKLGLASVTVFVLCLLLPGILPKTVPGMLFLSNLGIIGVSSLILVVLTILRAKDGEGIINITNCHKEVPWSVVWLMASTFPISDALKSADTGIMATVVEATMPLFTNISLTVFFIGATVILAVITQVSVNLVLGAVFIPFLCSICVDLGGNPYVLFMMLYTGLNLSFLTPAASANSALMHGHTWAKGSTSYTIGILYLVLGCVLMAVIGIPLGNLLF